MTPVPTILGPLYVDDQGGADEPVALLWPSLFTDHRMWAHQVPALREAGWRTLALDPPGHGRSVGPGRSFTMDECAEAVVQILDAAGVRTPVVIVGTSWGGFVAPRVALRAPNRVRAMVLFDTSAERPSLFEREKTALLTKLLGIERLDKVVDGMITSSMLGPETRRRHPEIARDIAEHLRAWDRRGVIATVRSVLVDRDAVLDALPEVKAPTLIVSGKEDHLLPSIHSQRIAEKLSNSRRRSAWRRASRPVGRATSRHFAASRLRSASSRARSTMVRVIHPIAGAIAFLTIATLWLSTVVIELLGSHAAVVALKTTIPWAFLLLVPALGLTAASGATLAKGQQRGLVGAKAKRMPFITANGLLVILPCALFLAFKAHAGELDMSFYAVQTLELAVGATNLALLGLSMRDGFAATAWKRGSFLRAAPTRAMRVLGTEEIAKGTLAIRIEKPSGFTYRAGQAVYLTLTDPAKSDDKGRTRTFSIASAPHERELLVAMRSGDSTFKRALSSVAEGAKLEIEGPFGDLVHADPARPAVFLAGGIGITPFRSMIVDAIERGLRHRLVLIYSNRVPESAAFLAELTALQNGHSNFELVVTMTDLAPGGADWSGERGTITREMIARHVGELGAPVYYLAGPPPMVAATAALLRDAGVKGADVHAEMFTGY